MMALSEKRVCDALKAREEELKQSTTAMDKVTMTLMSFFAPETCPGCACAFEHAGSCAAMHCGFCKEHFCLYCKTIFKSEGSTAKKGDISTIAHTHVFNCDKKPSKETILTDSVLFPVGCGLTDGRFLDAFFKVRRLEMLEFQMQQGECTLCMSFSYLKSKCSHSDWTPQECRRLVMDKDFQDVLKSIKERQTFYRDAFPEKPRLLSFAFHKVRVSVAVCKCTLNITQVIGIDAAFDFDVSTMNPAWMNNVEDGCLTERPKRRHLPPDDIEMRQLAPICDMGFTVAQARYALDACNGNIDLAVHMLFNWNE